MGQQQLGGALGEQHHGADRLHHVHVLCWGLHRGDDRQHVGGYAVHGKVATRFLLII